MGSLSVERGFIAEHVFVSMLKSRGVEHLRVNESHRDFIVKGVDVDVKSSNISHKCTRLMNGKVYPSYRIGQFNCSLAQRKVSLWLALFVYVNKQCVFLGMLNTPKRSKASYTLHEINNMCLLSLNDFIKKCGD